MLPHACQAEAGVYALRQDALLQPLHALGEVFLILMLCYVVVCYVASCHNIIS